MIGHRLALVCWGVLLLALLLSVHTGTLLGTGPIETGQGRPPAGTLKAGGASPGVRPVEKVLDAGSPADRIDAWIAARQNAQGVKPASLADDATFIRRIYLDLAGRIPSILEVRDFLDDPDPDKRRTWVERLLQSDTYARHFANVWRALLLSHVSTELTQALAPDLEAWLRQRLQANTRFDQMVREVLTTAPSSSRRPHAGAFLQAGEGKAEELAARTARVFLGIKLECAQCHDHPFAPWKRSQFWEFAALFGDLDREKGSESGRPELTIPGTDRVVRARFPDGTVPRIAPGVSPRAILADWLTSADNPFFARAVVNQLWAHFFGIGLVDPVDEAGDEDPPSHPELLDELARQLTAHRFDLKLLIRAIVTSQAYQRSSAGAHASSEDPRLFARRAVRGLTPEQLFDSLVEATEYQEPGSARLGPRFLWDVPSARAEFLATFPASDRSTVSQTSILQALFLMNGKFMADVTSPERSKLLTTIAASSAGTARRVETLYLVVLSRYPRPDEAVRLVPYVASGGPSGDPSRALADVFWALLNSAEFMLYH